jgi:hypothetical protein
MLTSADLSKAQAAFRQASAERKILLGAQFACVTVTALQKYLLYCYKSTCFTGTKVPQQDASCVLMSAGTKVPQQGEQDASSVLEQGSMLCCSMLRCATCCCIRTRQYLSKTQAAFQNKTSATKKKLLQHPNNAAQHTSASNSIRQHSTAYVFSATCC